MGTIFFILTVLVVPFMPAGATVPRWAFLSIICAALLFKIEIPFGVWLLMGYVGMMAWVAPVGYDAAFLYWHFLLFVILFLYAQKMTDLRGVAIGVGLAMIGNSALVLYETFVRHVMPSTIPDAGGLFFNHNLGTETAAMVMVLAIGYRFWWLIPGLLPTFWYGSRAPTLALGMAACVALWRRDRFQALLAFLATALAVAYITSYRNNGLGTFTDRLGVWEDLIPNLNLLGHGLGSFIVEFPLWQRHSDSLMFRYENAHNDILQVLYELGIGGLLLLMLLAWRMLWQPRWSKRSPEWYCLLVFIVEGCFGFPLYEPVTGGLAALCAGRLFIGCAPVRDLLDTVRSRIQDWHANHAVAVFRGVGRVVSPAADPTFGACLRSDSDPRLVEERFRQAGAPL